MTTVLPRKYNYVICDEESQITWCCLSDLAGRTDALRHVSFVDIMGRLYPLWKLHNDPRYCRRLNLPFKSLWNKRYLRGIAFQQERPLCFVMSGWWVKIVYETGLLKTIRKAYPGCRVVWFLQDLVKNQAPLYPWRSQQKHLDMDIARRMFDLIVSFDQADCREYGLTYHPLVYSTYIGERKQMPESDIYFCAKAKDRLPEIIKVYEKLRAEGLKLDFFLSGVPENDRVYTDDIKYGDFMWYLDNVQHVMHTRCLLEIMQKGGHGYTIRSCEAVAHGKKMLTNNPCITDAPFYHPDRISTFRSLTADDIDMDFVRAIPSGPAEVDYAYRKQLSPVELLDFLDNAL